MFRSLISNNIMSTLSKALKINLVGLYPLALCVLTCCAGTSSAGESMADTCVVAADTVAAVDSDAVQPREPAVEAILRAYPDFVSDISDNEVRMADGSVIVYDDGKEKDFLQRLDDTDIEDMFVIPYRRTAKEPAYLEDAGRMRNEQLFKAMYGSSSDEVRRNLVRVEWFGQSVLFNRNNGAADSLRAVAEELKLHPHLRQYLKSSGTFNWRPVRGVKRMSAHSYGIAFDIGVDYSDYWQWKSGSKDELARVSYANRIPMEIVEIFERHGFIWGGAWYHFDTMHFEFRPEILAYAVIARQLQE